MSECKDIIHYLEDTNKRQGQEVGERLQVRTVFLYSMVSTIEVSVIKVSVKKVSLIKVSVIKLCIFISFSLQD